MGAVCSVPPMLSKEEQAAKWRQIFDKVDLSGITNTGLNGDHSTEDTLNEDDIELNSL